MPGKLWFSEGVEMKDLDKKRVIDKKKKKSNRSITKSLILINNILLTFINSFYSCF